MEKFYSNVNTHMNKGITLIALVITIIVLLILAGITISMISGQDNVLQKAVEAKNASKEAEAKETAIMKVTDFIQDYYQQKYVQNNNANSTYSNVGEYVAEQFEEPIQSGNYYMQVEDDILKVSLDSEGNNVIVEGTIDEDGQISWQTSSQDDNSSAQTIGLAKDVLALEQDTNNSSNYKSIYVNYTLKGQTEPTLCKVLYNDGSNVEIIPVNPVDSIQLGWGDTQVTEQQINAEKATLQNSGLTYYKNTNGINTASTIDEFARAKASYNNAVTNLNARAVNDYMNTKLSSYARCVGTNPSAYNTELTVGFDGTGYNYNYLTNYKINDGSYKAADTIYTTDITQLGKIQAASFSDKSYGNYCWLPSRTITINSNGAYFYLRVNLGTTDGYLLSFGSNGNAYAYGYTYAFRPVFNLKSTVKILDDGNDGTTPEKAYNLK